MFLILGTSECKFCLESKKLLDSLNLKYTYVDLLLKFGDDWRCIFLVLDKVLLKQKSIPIIFHNFKEQTEVPVLTPQGLEDAGWKLIGTYFDLQDHVEDLDLSISDNY